MTQESNGFDPERAKKMASEVTNEFRGKLKKVERRTYALLLFFLALIAFYAKLFFEANSEKEWITWGGLLLVIYLSTVLIIVRYWAENTQINIMRELKEIRLANNASVVTAATPNKFRGTSWREQAVWIGASIVVMALILMTTDYQRHIRPVEKVMERYVDLAADGGGKVTTKWKYTSVFIPGMPRDSITRSFDSKEIESVRWYDAQWRELPSEMQEIDGKRVYTIRLPHPVLPGEEQTYYEVLERSGLAKEIDGVWKYQGKWDDAQQDEIYPTTKWTVTVRMPSGAVIVRNHPFGSIWKDVHGLRISMRGMVIWLNPKRTTTEWEVEYRLKPSAATMPDR
ncbi:MAG: hypothetical protein FWD53_05255 [Phycisphaerales bacterium]|nr:hypothetical protein [Phycisphaerales bacterium]